MKSIALTLSLAATVVLGSTAEASAPRAELLAGVSRSETRIELRHDQRSQPQGLPANRYGNRLSNRPGHGYDHRGYQNDRYRQGQHYAAGAVDQAREARRLGFYPDHPRWSLNYERHFNWALRTSERALQREHYLRVAQLREWRRQAASYSRYGYGYGDGNHDQRRH